MAKRSAIGQTDDLALSPLGKTNLLRNPLWQRDWFWGLVLILSVFFTYLPVGHAGFLWDDRLYLTENPHLQGWAGLKAIWTTSEADISPLTFTTFWLENALWGLNPLPFHLVNVLFHAADAILLWSVLRNLRIPGAWLGAALWALHPVAVESVAWVTETKNTESCLFFLLSILLFLRSEDPARKQNTHGTRWSYAAALLCAAFAMACKTSTVVLPVVLWLCVWWKTEHGPWRTLVRTFPFFLLSLLASALSLWTQSLQLATLTDPLFIRSGPERLATAGLAVWFYLGKLLWPFPLMTVYPRWQVDAIRWESYLPLVAMLVALAILWLKRESWARPWLFAFAYFLVALSPVIGLFDNTIFRYSFVFDHFQYLASMGPLALTGAGIFRLMNGPFSVRSYGAPVIACALLLPLALLSWQRVRAFESEKSLWSDTLTKDPRSWPAHYNLGVALLHDGQTAQAKTQFQQTLELYPRYPEAHLNLGITLSREGQIDAAMAEYLNSLTLNPNGVEAHNALGNALLQKGRVGPAILQFQEALAIVPRSATAHYNLGNAYLKNRQEADAIAQYETALLINPDLSSAHYNLGDVFLKQGKIDEAISQFQKTLETAPNDEKAHESLGEVLFQSGQKDEAILQLQEASQIDPASAGDHNNLANAFLLSGRVDDAVDQYQKALALAPDFIDAHQNLGAAFLHQGKNEDAMAQFREVLRLNPQDAKVSGILSKLQSRTIAAPK